MKNCRYSSSGGMIFLNQKIIETFVRSDLSFLKDFDVHSKRSHAASTSRCVNFLLPPTETVFPDWYVVTSRPIVRPAALRIISGFSPSASISALRPMAESSRSTISRSAAFWLGRVIPQPSRGLSASQSQRGGTVRRRSGSTLPLTQGEMEGITGSAGRADRSAAAPW